MNDAILSNYAIPAVFSMENMDYSNKRLRLIFNVRTSQPAITFSKLTIATLEQGVKYVLSQQ